MLDYLRTRRLNLEAIAALNAYLTKENHQSLLERAVGLNRDERDFLIASLDEPPRPQSPSSAAAAIELALPSFPAPEPPREPSKVDARTRIVPVSADAARVVFIADRDLIALIQRAGELLSHRFPTADPKELIRVPRRVRDEVYKRDGGRCTYEAAGRRCDARRMLEYDHKHPWALGGSSTDPENIRLLCRAHNLLLARDRFGPPPGRGAAAS